MSDLTQERLKELLDYDPETGVFRWRVRRPHAAVGQRGGHIMALGYRSLRVFNQQYYAHRLAWFWMTGSWPDSQIDHRDGVRDNNAWSNLREATTQEQAQNLARSKRNTSGYRGVCFDKARGTWIARLGFQHLGRYSSAEEAYGAYLRAKPKLHPFQPIPRDA